MQTYPTFRANFLFLLLILLGACSKTSVKIPPGMTEADLATVQFYSPKDIDTSYLAVDGVGQGIFDSGLQVVPGEHEATCDYTFSDQQCYWRNYCVETAFYGNCRASLRAEKGASYAVKLRRASTSVFISVVDAKTGEVAGSGNCTETRSAPLETRGSVKLH